MKKQLLTLASLLFAFSAMADTWTDPATGIEWNYEVSNGEVALAHDDERDEPAIRFKKKGAIVIPSVLGGYPVTSIGDSAFWGCSGLTSVTIPSSVTSIGVYAFYGCSGLRSVTIPASVTSIGDDAFYGCSGLTSVTIPSSVTIIGDSAFADNGSMTSITVASGNKSFKSVDGVLYTANGRKLIQYPGAKSGSFSIPSSVTSIGYGAFYGCSGLTSVTIPSSVTSIGDYAFAGCSGLTEFIVDANNPSYCSVNGLLLSKDGKTLVSGVNVNVTIPSSVTSIGDYAFDGCIGLKSVTIPSSVTSIGDCAFWGCSGLTSVTIPSSVKSIGYGAFVDCSGLTSVTIPSSVTSIGDWAFDGCSGLTSVTIPSSVTSIGDCAFDECGGLTAINVQSGNGVYKSLDGILYSKDGTELIQCPGGKSGDVTIPSSVTSIGDYAFDGCIGLMSVTIPSSVTVIGDWAFDYCSGLTEFIVDAKNQSYRSVNGLLLSKDGKTLVSGVNGNVTIPSGVTVVGDSAFDGRSGLTSVTIPSRVTSIGDWAFDECDSLETVYVESGDEDRVRNLYDWDDGITFVGRGSLDDPDDDSLDASVANAYDGVIVDSDGMPMGSISIKTAKSSGKGDAAVSKVTATILMAGEAKKITVKADMSVSEVGFTATASDERVLELSFSRNVVWGSFGDYAIEGSRNLLASTAKSDKGTDAKVAADAVCAALKGNYVLAYLDENGWNGLSVSVAAKGKVKVSGKLANGTSVSVTSQLIVGSEKSVIPVIYTKGTTSLAFNITFDDDGNISVCGNYDAEISPVGSLRSGSTLYLGAEIEDLFGDYTLLTDFLPYEISVEPSGTKWIVAGGAKAGKIKIDRASGDVYDANESDNPSGLKLTYTAKTGVFKGSFKVYALDASGKLKTFSATVTGVVVDGYGYGAATIKKIGSCAVEID